MANSLLDFVISLVRDPEAAARYAANPAQSIADAHLADVTSADVNNLIPMVSDSLSMADPAGAAPATHIADHGNVWASGAATAALDAFSPHPPSHVESKDISPIPASSVISQPAVPGPGDVPPDPQPLGIAPYDPSVLVTGTEVPEAPLDHGGFPAHDPGIWDHPVTDPDAGEPDHHGFGIDHHGFGVDG